MPPHARLFRRDLVVDGVCIKAAVDIITFRVPVRSNQPACSRPVVQHRSAQKCAVKKGNLVEEPGEGSGFVAVVEGGLEQAARVMWLYSPPSQRRCRTPYEEVLSPGFSTAAQWATTVGTVGPINIQTDIVASSAG